MSGQESIKGPVERSIRSLCHLTGGSPPARWGGGSHVSWIMSRLSLQSGTWGGETGKGGVSAADTNPIPPWIFRHRNELATLQPNRLETPSTHSVTPPNLSTSLPILGNKRSKKYHRPDCPSYNRITKKNRVPFGSLREARDAGYVLAGNCPH